MTQPTTPATLARDIDSVMATMDALQAAFAAAAGTFTCPCGAETEFDGSASIEDYAALNRWLGHHARCDLDGTLRTDPPVVPQSELTERRVREIVREEIHSASRTKQVALRDNDPRRQVLEQIFKAVPAVLEAIADASRQATSQPMTVNGGPGADPTEFTAAEDGAR